MPNSSTRIINNIQLTSQIVMKREKSYVDKQVASCSETKKPHHGDGTPRSRWYDDVRAVLLEME